MLPVHRAERAARVVARRFVVERQEQPPTHDLEAFFGADRLPDGFHAPERVLDPRQRLPARVAADLHVRLGDGGHEYRVPARSDRLGQFLTKVCTASKVPAANPSTP